MSLGQVACAEKSNEITAIPELLRLVDIKGCGWSDDFMMEVRTGATNS
jgi:predicted transposase YbfD/YdcC